MSSLIVPTEIASFLRQFQEVTELRDSQGNVLGAFTPLTVAAGSSSPQAGVLFDLEEAERVLAAEWDKGRPLKDILRDMEILGKQG